MVEIDLKQIGQNMRSCRERAGMTQQRLCRLSGVSRNGLYSCESGRSAMGLYNLVQVADVLGVSIDAYIGVGKVAAEARAVMDLSLATRDTFGSDGAYINYLIGVIYNLEHARCNLRALVDALERREPIVPCGRCISWEADIDPETGEEIHRCDCCASPRLDDVTAAEDGCVYGKEADHEQHDQRRSRHDD